MLSLLFNLLPANLLHEFGTGRALDNAGRETEEVAHTMAIIDALAGRLERAASAVGASVEEPVAA